MKEFEINNGILIKYHGNSDTVVIPNGVSDIAEDAFLECFNITTIVLPQGLKNIGNRAFKGCGGIEEILLPESIISVGAEAFKHCDWLNHVDIPDSIEYIGENAFSWCRNLETINCFKTANTPKHYKSNDGILYTNDGKTLVCYPMGKVDGSFEIPRGVKHIGPFSIVGNLWLNRIILPEGLLTIEDSAFAECIELRSVTIPDTLKVIHKDAFFYCRSIIDFKISDNHKYFKNIEDSLYTKDQTALICYAAGYDDSVFIIPAGVKTINKYAFFRCAFTEVVIPNSVESIGEGAFFESDLEAIVIPKEVSTIGENAFPISNNLIIHGEIGSYAELYAKGNDIDFKSIE